MDEELFDRGVKKLAELDDNIAEQIQQALGDVAPDLARYSIAFGFGEVYSRTDLTLAEREIASIAALVAMATAPAQLKVHIRAGLKVGLTPAKITGIIIQMVLYQGFPAALNAMAIAREVFREQGFLAGAQN